MAKIPDLDTLAVHASQPPDAQTRALVTPIHLSTTFAQSGSLQAGDFEYGRTDNPTRRTLEGCVAALEGGEHATAFASGSAATMTVLQTLSPGDEVISCDDVYGGTYRLMENLFVPMGVKVHWVDMADVTNVAGLLNDRTRLIWVESPTNPLLKIVDIQALSDVAGQHGVRLVVDNTFATPVLQRPLSLGAHGVVHSSTKYLNGHGDVIGGVVVTNDAELHGRLRYLQNAAGAIPSPFDCYMVLRGIKTLPLRVRHQSESAGKLAQWLEQQSGVGRVLYPGLPSHPQHGLAARQMAAGGGMISVVLAGGEPAATRLLRAVRLFHCAESLGGVESLIEHPASMTHAAIPPEVRAATGIDDGLVRLSVGLESVADLQADREQALG